MPESPLPDLDRRLRAAADATVLDQPLAAPGIRRRAERRQRVHLLGAAAGLAAVLAVGLGVAGPMSDRGLAPADGGSTSPSVPVTPEPTVPVTPSPTIPVTPSPTIPVTPSPTISVTPEPSISVTPSPTISVTPEPTVEVTPSP